MRSLVLFLASILAAGAIVVSAGAASPDAGTLDVDGARGVVILDIRGVVLGRMAGGTLVVRDRTPRDRFAPLVTGRRLTVERTGPNTVVYRGQALRFRMLGGGHRTVARGTGISIAAVGKGAVTLQADRRVFGEDAGVYSLDGADCGLEPWRCTPLPDSPERFVIGPKDETDPRR